RIQACVRETIAVGDPAFVHVFVFEGNNTHDAIVLGLHHEVGANAVVRADHATAGQFPGTCRETERLGSERAHGIDVDHIARQLGLDRAPHERSDLGVFSAIHHAHFHHAGNFLAETDATRAMDATLHFFGADQRADVFAAHDTLGLAVAGFGTTETYGELLQLTLATLVTDRA